MKCIVRLFVIPLIGIGLMAGTAQAQRSGSMQATARVLDIRENLQGFQSGRIIASLLARSRESNATVETSLTRVSVELGTSRDADRPRPATITINYLRN